MLGNWSASAPDLRSRDVHVWRLRPAEYDVDHGWSLLSTDERERASRFYLDVHRNFYVATHAAVRRVIGSYLNKAPDALTLLEGLNGKPAVSNATLEFNLSHSGEFALLAISSDARVGVDVERWRHAHAAELITLATRFFSEREREGVCDSTLNDACVVQRFYAVWSRKEAYLKASGVGITGGLDHFSMSHDEPARLLEDQHDADAMSRWTVAALPVGNGYAAALVAEAPVNRVELVDGSALPK
jgi:4'-phosphopantetheinyl transferase